MNKTYLKSIIADMKKTKGKLISIMVMVALASLVVVGLLLSGPSMRKSLDNSLRIYQHPDLIVNSSYGLDFEDKAIIENQDNISKIDFIKATDLIDRDMLIRVKEYDRQIPKAVISSGRMIKKPDEIVLEEKLKDKYKIGDEISFSYINNDQKKNNEMARLKYKLVGFYKSSDYFLEDMKEISPLGKSEINGYAYVLSENFKADKYNEANIVFSDLEGMDKTSKAYIKSIKSKKGDLEYLMKNRPEEVLRNIKRDANKEISDAQDDLNKAERDISNNEKKLIESKKDLDAAFVKYEKNKEDFNKKIKKAEDDLAKAHAKLVDGKSKVKAGKDEYQANLDKYNKYIANGQKELDKKQKELNLGFAQIDGPKKEMDKAYDNLNKMYEASFNQLKEAEASLIIEENYIKTKKQDLDELNRSDKKANPNIEGQILSLKEEIKQREDALFINRAIYESDKKDLASKYQASKYELDQKLGGVRQKEDELKKAKKQIDKAYAEFNQKKEYGKLELDKAKNKIITSEKELSDGQKAYEKGQADLRENKIEGERKLSEAYQKLLKGEKDYREGKKKFEEEKEKADKDISKAKKDIGDSKQALLSLQDPEYKIESIFDNRGINTYYQNSLNMDRLSKVFPAFFYLVAMLVTLTTMKRYIAEQRMINGCFKSLGYSNKDIAKRFYIYGIIPTIFASLLGAILGRFVIVKVIFDAYSTGFKVLAMDVINSLFAIIIAVSVSTFLIALTIFISSKETVKEVPANLLKAKAPESGTKILLERIKFLWKRLSFMRKITARNLFRYKSRMFMTVFGVGGCTALLFFGFAMMDAIKDTSAIQQKEILHYQAVSMINTKAKKEDLDSYEKLIGAYDNLSIYNKEASLESDGKDLKLSIIIPENDENLSDFVSLRDLKRKKLNLADNQVIITENIARKLGLKVSDTIKLNIDDKDQDLKISAINENYVNDYIYVSKDYYEKNIGKLPSFNSNLIKGDPFEIKDKLDKNKAVNAVVNKTGVYESIDALLDNLMLVILVITLISSALAIVVLYNITSINVGERKRELATIKVLGFYPREVTSYIYREIFILTLMGILVGFFLGYLMFRYILIIVAPENIMISYRTHILSYVISSAITLVISLLILIFVHRDLKKIDMAEAMSSGE